MIFDSHCHLNSEELFINIDKVIEDAQKVGVSSFLVVGWNKESSLKALQIANKYPFCWAAIGYHPTDVFEAEANALEEIKKLASSNKKVVAIGEIGLDYYWEKDRQKQQIQKEWFIKQIQLANELNLPIVVHNRDAIQDCLEILKSNKPTNGGIVHCFSGSVETMQEMLKLGMIIGLGGPLTFKNAKTPKEVALKCPLDKLVVETDCPYLAPHPLRGTLNEPKNIKLIVEEMSKIKNIDVDELEDQLYRNTLRIFKIYEE